jgi:branched-chain amino acid transport system permease protein
MFNILLPSLADGLLLGFVYGIAAMGLSLIWGVMNVINLSHGPIIALGMFGIYLTFSIFGLNPYLAVIIVAVLGLLLGIVIYAIAVHRVINAPHLSTLLATFSVNMIMIGIGTAILTTTPRNIDFTLGRISLGPITLLWTRIAAALAAILVTALLYLFLYRSRPGKYIRAVANNRTAAELMGIPSAILSGTRFEVKSFVICVLGGLGNPLGALIGGLILGSLEGLIPVFMPTTWVPVLEFGLFVLILLVRPSGLLGKKS